MGNHRIAWNRFIYQQKVERFIYLQKIEFINNLHVQRQNVPIIHTMEDSVLFKDVQSRIFGSSIYDQLDEKSTLEFLDYMDPRSYDLDNLLLVACWRSTDAVIRRLIDLGANQETLSVEFSTPIMFVAQRDMLETFKYFVSLGVDPVHVYEHGDRVKCVDHFLKDTYKIAKYMRAHRNEKLTQTLEVEKKCEDFENQIRMLTEQLASSSVRDDYCDDRRKRVKPCKRNEVEWNREI
jgi:hypothetical protein